MINGDATGTIDLRNLNITGDLTINTPTAHVNVAGTVTVGGATNVQDVSNSSFVSAGTHTGGIVVTDTNGSTINLSGNARSASVRLNTNGPVTLAGSYTGTVTVSHVATVNVALGASIASLVIESEAAGATVNNAGAITNVTANTDVIISGTQPTGNITGSGSVAANQGDLDAKRTAKKALTTFLETAKYHEYSDLPSLGNFKDLKTLTISGLSVTIDISRDSAEIEAIQSKPSVENGTATGLYVMNTMARYLGALNYADDGVLVKEIEYGGKTYTWQEKQGTTGGYLKGSNWRQTDLITLVSIITVDIAKLEEDDSLTVTLVDAENNSIDVKFAVKTK